MREEPQPQAPAISESSTLRKESVTEQSAGPVPMDVGNDGQGGSIETPGPKEQKGTVAIKQNFESSID